MALSAGGKAFYNVTILGVAFLLVFTAFQTCGMIQTVVLRDDKDFQGSGYDSLAIIYAVFAAANWIAPSVVALLGARCSMFLSAVVYTGFVASFLHPIPWVLYSLSGLLGLAAAVIWTAQGNYLTENSTEQTMGRNSGLFWAMLQGSLLFGNLFFFLEMEGINSVTTHLRTIIFIVLTVISGVGVLTFLFLTKPPEEFSSLSIQEEGPTGGFGLLMKAVTAFVRSAKLMLNKEMLIISVTNFYTGLELTFFSGVYGTAISNTKSFGADSNSFIGISGMLIGAGEITGGLLFGILGKKTIKFGRDPIVLLGYVVHMICFYLIYINLPAESPINPVFPRNGVPVSIIGPNIELAFACSFMLGFADACFNTQIYSLLGSYFKSDSASAFALFKFIQSAAAAIAFAYSLVILLHWQLLILVVCGTLGTLSFFYVEHHPPRNEI
ncbi:UNC93-like protein MFSD11 [Strongylocentrotus purpuratus]|uniref:UNC93-like protein MFSD11 n=1 Tax=Strongylocentrotus purpuratus TaxID=7668 RepID=A0A7M7RDF8_STRPU|nr:UNC93-like protein MFSD11 [Strongylocentrotus purpuratus]|eukprot:XP_792285.2 PREDICTED: UNC93-like protein MFSD11 [Strongylocentrotus purpuratus]